MLALGVPGSATTAVMLGAFLMLDIQAGPMLFLERPDVVWGLVAALYVGNIFLLILADPANLSHPIQSFFHKNHDFFIENML